MIYALLNNELKNDVFTKANWVYICVFYYCPDNHSFSICN